MQDDHTADINACPRRMRADASREEPTQPRGRTVWEPVDQPGTELHRPGFRDCHLEPDWLLIYKSTEDTLILERTGSHSELFKK